jgi:hypothetical protein
MPVKQFSLFFATLVSSLTPMEAKLLVSDGEIGQDEANAYIAFINYIIEKYVVIFFKLMVFLGSFECKKSASSSVGRCERRNHLKSCLQLDYAALDYLVICFFR